MTGQTGRQARLALSLSLSHYNLSLSHFVPGKLKCAVSREIGGGGKNNFSRGNENRALFFVAPFCNFYLEEPGATVAGEDAVVLSRGVVGADLARNVVENPTCESK